MSRTTEEPQRTGDSRADAEWKADSGLGNLVHGVESGSEVDRSDRAASVPDAAKGGDGATASGGGSRGAAGAEGGSGKGPLDPDVDAPKKRQDL